MTASGRPIRVLIGVPWDQPHGGVATVAGNLGRYLSAVGHRVAFFHPGKESSITAERTTQGFNGYYMRMRQWSSTEHPVRAPLAFALTLPGTLRKLRRTVKSEDLQIVNIHYPVPSMVAFALLRRMGYFRLVVSIHGADLFPGGEPASRIARETRVLLGSADGIVAPSESLMREFRTNWPEFSGKSHFIHNGIDPEALVGLSQVSDARQSPYLLCVAAHNEKKALDVLLSAYARLVRSKRGKLPALVLVGDGPLREELETLADSLGLLQHVRFMGARPREEVIHWISGCEAVVLPSRAEPFGIVVLEALALGKPVVASRVGGIPEILEGSGLGILTRPDDPSALATSLDRVLRDDDLRTRARQRGFDFVRSSFHYSRTGEEYVALFRALLTDHAVPDR